MPRTTKALTAKKKHKKTLSSTKGHYGARSRLFKTAKQSAIKSLWISRINSAARVNETSYSQLMNSLSKSKVLLNRKILADLAVNDTPAFTKVVEITRNS